MIEVRGVHPIEASEPVFMVDVAISGQFEDVDWGSITQSDPDLPPENWQAAYDERELPRLPDGRARAAFFFHYLDPTKPLMFSSKPISIPRPTPVPADLAAVQYEQP
jgi:hypothetical protein